MKIRRRTSSKNVMRIQLITVIIGAFITYFTGDLFALLTFIAFIFILYTLTILSIKIIKSGNVKFIKDFSNTIWNISTAASFSYAIYLLLRYKIRNITIEYVSTSYINLHPYLSFSILAFLVFTAILRASVSIAELLTTDYLER